MSEVRNRARSQTKQSTVDGHGGATLKNGVWVTVPFLHAHTLPPSPPKLPR